MKQSLYQVHQTSGILLNANESPYPISPQILDEIKTSLNEIAFHRYPDDNAQCLRSAYANYLNIATDQIIIGNGSDEMIGLIISTCITKAKKVYTLDPDFSMYDYYTSMNEGVMVTYAYGPDDAFSISDFITYGQKQQIDLILFSNPNNPTGKTISIETIQTILEAFPHIPVVVDEAYGEFAQSSCIPLIDTYQNLIVLRTMSKAFGMAAIRCGCMVAHENTIAKIRPFKVPYNVNTLTQHIATILLKHADTLTEQIETIKSERDRIYHTITKANCSDIRLYPSKANYLYGQSKKKAQLLQALANKHIIIRNYENSDAFRITVGTPQENDLLIEVIITEFAKTERN